MLKFTEVLLKDVIDYFQKGFYSTVEGKELEVIRYSVDVNKGTVLFVLNEEDKTQ